MGLKELFSLIPNISAEDAKKYADERSEGDFTLLDVRQPLEYKLTHIPGAKLIPLPELFDRVNELDPKKPVIVY